mmetsp:Transcript_9760/g.19171  ORF Transcript_9760/g.19171 Transcript_9760/m.19171 type:complete len:327 (-) Transcript_9760:204-1184(-)|eukprot:CAMPEP_0171486588 /NCGR_PEP_ID=MMETSP0958-20121227/1172_1 /TAXON_ID=87120 /ORGANISM="Aurantiochytrium limacinum, Strain ATCCMYA-1381" /LENGTH=326 /DNA_ID=CAMNT_0012019481 /DNA_START=82 /DNA_END=1062 /DNA_ORIENTATION=-
MARGAASASCRWAFLVVAATLATGSLAQVSSQVSGSGECVDLGSDMSLMASGCLYELTEDNFEQFLDQSLVSCVLFYENDNAAFKVAEAEFKDAASRLATHGNLSVATMHISSNPRVARSTAATGPVSVKLFDKRLRSQNFYDLYALHLNGPRFEITGETLFNLMQDYYQNSTGHEALDEIAQDFAHSVMQRDDEYAEKALAQAREVAKDLSNGMVYLSAMESVKNKGLYVIAKAFNDVSLELGSASQPQVSESRLPLEQRARALLFMHISGELSKPLLSKGKVPTYTRKFTTPAEDAPKDSEKTAEAARAAAARAAAQAAGTSLE